MTDLKRELDALKRALFDLLAAKDERIEGLEAVIEHQSKTLTEHRLRSVATIEELERENELLKERLEKAHA